MKVAIFTWLFLLPVQIYASSYSSQLSDQLPLTTTLQESKVGLMEAGNLELVSNSEFITESGNF